MLGYLEIRDDLTLSIGSATVRLSPSEGLDFAETLARKSFRRALAEEAVALAPGFDPDETSAATGGKTQ